MSARPLVNQRQVNFAKAKLAAVLVLIVIAFLLSGCSAKPTPEQEWGIDQCLRAELFGQCMKMLPAGPSSTKYNDWDEVVNSCESAAHKQSVRADYRAIKPGCRL